MRGSGFILYSTRSSNKRLAQDLAAVDPLPALIGADTSKHVNLYLLKIERPRHRIARSLIGCALLTFFHCGQTFRARVLKCQLAFSNCKYAFK